MARANHKSRKRSMEYVDGCLNVFSHTLIDGYTFDKWTELRLRLEQKPSDVIVLTDLKGNNKGIEIKAVKEYFIPGFKYFVNDKVDEPQNQGVAIYVNENITCQLNTALSALYADSLWVIVGRSDTEQVVVGGIYIERSDGRLPVELIDTLRQLTSVYLRPHHQVLHTSSQLIIPAGQRLHLQPVPGSSLLVNDIIKVLNPNYALILEAGLGVSKFPVFIVETQFIPRRRCEFEYTKKVFESANHAMIKNTLDIDWDACLQHCRTTDEYIIEIKRRIDAALRYVHKEKQPRKGTSPPWSINDMSELLSEKLVKGISSFPPNTKNYVTCAYELATMYHEAKANYEQNMDVEELKDGSEYSIASSNSSSIPDTVYLPDDTPKEDPVKKAEAFAQHFYSIHRAETVFDEGCIPNVMAADQMTFPPVNITTDDVAAELENLKTKGPGPDHLHPAALKEFSQYLCTPLTILFNRVLMTGDIPPIWKVAKVTPVFKEKGNAAYIANYRPISITSCVCKMLERILARHIDAQFVETRVLSPFQHGYKCQRSPTTNLLFSLNSWTSHLDKGLSVDVVFLDLSKAYDTVPHERLLRLLSRYGIKNQLLRFCENFLRERKQFVHVDTEDSAHMGLPSGVPQGCVLSNLLFAIFMNHIPKMIASSVAMYCDDIKIWSPLRCIDGQYMSPLQDDLNVLYKWVTDMNMEFSLSKCKVMHLGEKNPELTYTLNNESLSKTDDYKDLGVTYDKTLSFEKHITGKIDLAMHRIDLLQLKFTHLSLDSFMAKYCPDIRSLVESSSCVWSPQEKQLSDAIEQVQQQAVKHITSSDICNLSYSEVLKVIQLPTLWYRRLRCDLVWFFRYIHNYQKYNHSFTFIENPEFHAFAVEIDNNVGDLRKSFFFNRTATRWNMLPPDLVGVEDSEAFGKALDEHFAEEKYEYVFDTPDGFNV